MNCIFCEFISGKRKKHANGVPFKKLHETEHSLTFLSIDFPATEEGHTIVIPKKHFNLIEDIPNNILLDVIKETKLVSKILRQKNEGTNILINNGKSAGQKIPHIHLHIIPRNKDDKIDLEHFKRKQLSIKQFSELQSTLIQKYSSLKNNIRVYSATKNLHSPSKVRYV